MNIQFATSALRPFRLLLTGVLMLPLCLASLDAQHQLDLTRINGEVISSQVTAIANGVITAGENDIELDGLMMIQTGRSVVEQKSPVTVGLAGGGELSATGVRFSGEQFVIDSEYGQYNVPLDSITGVVFDQHADLSRYQRAAKNRSVEHDVVIATSSGNQHVVEGLIESISDEKVAINHQGKSRTISISRVVAIVTADLKPDSQSGTQAMVKLINGSVIAGVIGKLDSGVLELRLPGNGTINISMNQVAMISLKSDRVVFLSDLEPLDVEQTSLATIPFDWQRDLSVEGNPPRLYSYSTGKTTQYPKSVGMHAASRIEFANVENFNRFAATAGIDVETGGKGDCRVSVWADGIKLWEADISGSKDPVKVDVDITGMKTISLVVRNGPHLDMGDHVDWAEARLLKTD